jgi:hypothetical protein
VAAVTVGRISDAPSANTIQHKITTFLATWTCQSSTQMPKSVCQQTFAYLNSSKFTSAAALTMASREKRVAHTIDIELLLEAMWDDESHFRTPRERITCTTVTCIQSLTNDRPGTFTTHSSRPDCTDSILISHVDVRIQPNPDEPRSPTVYTILKINDPKNGYKNNSVYKYVIFYPEPDQSCSMCVITNIMTQCKILPHPTPWQA